MSYMIYAGIGSRRTPSDVLRWMGTFSASMANQGWTLRSGGAHGADSAFEAGARRADGSIEVFRPEDVTHEALKMASEVHPAWDKCTDYVRKLHARNCQIILGRNLDAPARFVVCWTPDGELRGGTAQGIRIAKARQIPVFNLGNEEGGKNLMHYLVHVCGLLKVN